MASSAQGLSPSTSFPRKATYNGLHPYSNLDNGLEDKRLQYCVEMSGFFVGELPVGDFLNRFLPETTPRMAEIDFKKVPQGPGRETSMYKPFADAIKESRCCPSFEVRNTSETPDSRSRAKPDCGFFLKASRVAKWQVKSEQSHMSRVDIPVEMKPQSCQDAYIDNMNDRKLVGVEVSQETKMATPLTKNTESSIKHRGQQIDYVTQIMSMQHRTHVFFISIVGHRARLIRWDRAGAVVSASFNYVDRGEHLADFLHRYEKATLAQRGFDTSATSPSKKDYDRFVKAVKQHACKVHRSPGQTMKIEDTLDDKYPPYKLLVGGNEGHAYIVQRPFFNALSPCGRATRGYLAIDCQKWKPFFLKDAWRIKVDGVLSERDVYHLLESHDVPHLPTVVESGDVSHPAASDQPPSNLSEYEAGSPPSAALQQTCTHEVAERRHGWMCPTAHIGIYVHHRIVQELALPLWMVRNSKQLVQAVRNALEAIRDARHKAKVLHRDVSARNLMLDSELRGILNDWDHAAKLDADSHEHRTGTWQFMSIALLRYAHKRHDILDDVESCFWVLLYIAIHYFAQIGDEKIDPTMFDEFKEKYDHKTKRVIAVGGNDKYSFLTSETWKTIEFRSKPFTRLFQTFAKDLGDFHHYQYNLRKEHPDFDNFVEVRDKLTAVDKVLAYFDSALHADDWPSEDDAVPDQYPQQTRMKEYQQLENTRQLSYSEPSWNSNNPQPDYSTAVGKDKDAPAPDAELRPSAGPSSVSGLMGPPPVPSSRSRRRLQPNAPLPKNTIVVPADHSPTSSRRANTQTVGAQRKESEKARGKKRAKPEETPVPAELSPAARAATMERFEGMAGPSRYELRSRQSVLSLKVLDVPSSPVKRPRRGGR